MIRIRKFVPTKALMVFCLLAALGACSDNGELDQANVDTATTAVVGEPDSTQPKFDNVGTPIGEGDPVPPGVLIARCSSNPTGVGESSFSVEFSVLDPSAGSVRALSSASGTGGAGCDARALYSADLRWFAVQLGEAGNPGASWVGVVDVASGDITNVTELRRPSSESFSETDPVDSMPFFVGQTLYFSDQTERADGVSDVQLGSSQFRLLAFDPETGEFDENPDTPPFRWECSWCVLSPDGRRIASPDSATAADSTEFLRLGTDLELPNQNGAQGGCFYTQGPETLAATITWVDNDRLICGDNMLRTFDLAESTIREAEKCCDGELVDEWLVDPVDTVTENPNMNGYPVVDPDGDTVYFLSRTDEGEFLAYSARIGSGDEPEVVSSSLSDDVVALGWWSP